MYKRLSDLHNKPGPYAYAIDDIESGTQQEAQSLVKTANPDPAYRTWSPEQVWLLLRDHGFEDTVCNDFLEHRVNGQSFATLSLFDLRPPLFRGDTATRQRLFELIIRCTQGAASGAPIPVPYQSQWPADGQPQIQVGKASLGQPVPVAIGDRETLVEYSISGDLFVGDDSGRFTVQNQGSTKTMAVILPTIIAAGVMFPISLTGGFSLLFSFGITGGIFFLMLVATRFMTADSYEYRFTPTHVYYKNGQTEERAIPNTNLRSVCAVIDDSLGSDVHIHKLHIKLNPGHMLFDSDRLMIETRFTSIQKLKSMGQKLARLLNVDYEEVVE